MLVVCTNNNNSGFGFKNISGSRKTDHPWYCSLREYKFQDKDTAFICDVGVPAKLFCLFTNERQLNNLQRFCCYVNLFKALTVDLTFDIGEFHVMPILYQLLLLET